MGSSFVILLVDDSKSLRSLIRKALESAGFDNLMEADDGKKALDILSANPVDLIISDINMPRINGIELLKSVLKNPFLKKIPFIVLTSETHNKTFKEAMQIGATDFIKKPFTRDDLITKIKSIIAWL